MVQFTEKMADHAHEEDTNGTGLFPHYGSAVGLVRLLASSG